MPHDPLDTVLRLRRRAVEDTRCALAAGLAAAHAADIAARAADQAIADEMEAASAIDGDDGLVEAFAAWLPSGQHRLAQARARQEFASAEVCRIRAELSACQTALEIIERLRGERLQAQATARAHQAQRAIDEAAANRPPRDA